MNFNICYIFYIFKITLYYILITKNTKQYTVHITQYTVHNVISNIKLLHYIIKYISIIIIEIYLITNVVTTSVIIIIKLPIISFEFKYSEKNIIPQIARIGN